MPIVQISLKQSRLALRNSTTRIAFRYGSACLTRCPQAVFQATIETGGKTQHGYSGDCLPPSWFDKSPDKDYRRQIDDMLSVIALAEEIFTEELDAPAHFFPAWLTAYRRVHRQASEQGMTPLLASFGASMVERAILDAMARAAGVSFAKATRDNLYGIEPGEVHPSLDRLHPADWLPEEPKTSVFGRHTVGLGDPLTSADIPMEQRLNDGFPQALEEYIQQTGLRYFKIKVSNRLDADLDRLKTIAALVERYRGEDYRITLDGNEQYKQPEQFDELIASITAADELRTLWANTLLVEQPLERSIALEEEYTDGIRTLGQHKPVIIDESDGAMDSYSRAIELGYRGVSSKNCKGAIKSLLNAGLTWLRNDRGATNNYLMTGEDLCSVGVIPVQADMCLGATLGLEHIERNGHHFHPGLSYLSESERGAALAAHGDFYFEQNGVVSPHLVDGRFQIASLQCVGFGFAALPDLDSMLSPQQWDFASLGLE